MKMIMEAVIVIILWHYNTMKMRISELSEYQKQQIRTCREIKNHKSTKKSVT